MNFLHDHCSEEEKQYNRAYWESLSNDVEPVEPFSRVPKCIQRRENELRKRNDETVTKKEGEVLPVRKQDNNKDGGPTARALGRGFTEGEAREMFQ